jgi:dethiobiotin synthetase
MMKNIFITATNTNVGKTYTTLKLLHHFHNLGYKVGAFKPIETGVEDKTVDASKLLKTLKQLNPNFSDSTTSDICPIQLPLPAAPFVACDDIDISKIEKSFKKIQKHCDILLIEGAGGLLVPVTDSFYMVDFINLFEASTLLVTDDKLGSINATLLSMEVLKQRDITFTWCVNIFDRKNYITTMEPFYHNHFQKVLTLQKDIEQIASNLL